MRLTFEEYWRRLCDKNPGLRDEAGVIRMSTASFKKAMQQAFEVERDPPPNPGSKSKLEDLFKDLYK